MKHIVVTGGAGFLGSHLVDKLIQDGEEVTVIDNLFRGQSENINAHMDNKNFKLLTDAIQNRQKIEKDLLEADAVVHFASISSVFRSITDPEEVNTVNVTGTINLLNLCVKQDVQKFIFSSSAAVYGGIINRPMRENDPVYPLSPFAASKIAGEAYCQAYYETYSLHTIILRFWNVYGPRTTKTYRRVNSKFAEAICKKEPLKITGNGKQTRDFTYVSDAVDAIILALNNKTIKGQTINIGTGKPTTINQLANLYKKIGGNPNQEIQHISPKKGDLINSYADITKAKKTLEYKPKIDLETGIPKYLEWYKQYHKQNK